MKKSVLKLTVGIAVFAATSAITQAQTATTTPAAPAAPAVSVAATPAPPPPTTFDEWANEVKNPVGWFSWGGDMRVRNEYFNNALSLGSGPSSGPFGPVHEQDYFRYRGRIWASFFPTNDLTVNVRLAAEPREFLRDSTMDTYFDKSGWQWRYGIIDTLNVQWKHPLDLPATVTVGRQDINLGDNWLFGDGTPEDGSFTSFLDSARVTVNLKDQHTTIDAIGIVQYGRPDAWLPTIGPSTTQGENPNAYLLTDQNEKGAVLYIANKSLPAANLDGFFIYKHDSALNDAPASIFSDNADIFTVGGRVSGLVEEHWNYSAEGAYQFGRKQYQYNPNGTGMPIPIAADGRFHDIDAFGVNSKISYLFKDELNNQLSLVFEFLSGDNPKTGNDEMFDVLWGRWPQWSEMYNIYSYVNETRVGQTANLIRFGPSWSVDPIKDMNFSLTYNALFADQDVPTQATVPTAFTGTGDFRGHYLQSIIKYKFTKHLSGLLLGECLFPGDFYTSRQVMDFVRVELMYTF
ncbi:MAG: alginate export family protein [Limisphaerales bacterium]